MMREKLVSATILVLVLSITAFAAMPSFVHKTSAGDLKVTLIGHGSLMLEVDDKVIHVDPFSKMADYAKMPKADLILITHEHGDHLDPAAVDKIRTGKTAIVGNQAAAAKINGTAIGNGKTIEAAGFKIEAIPAYNIVHKRESGKPFHPKGNGNGYVITIGDTRVYIAGDTENIPEMKSLKNIDIAFLPINLPYTMDAEMFMEAVKGLKPKVVYPYHHTLGRTDVDKLPEMMKDIEGVKLRMSQSKER
jgi:L-ascorbate metabolism protein UlaG (beta-lactamase superfamily)